MIRQNVLDVLLSKRLVEASGQAHLVTDTNVARTDSKHLEQQTSVAVYLDPATIIYELTWLRKKNRWMTRLLRYLGLPFLEITYER